MKQEGAFGEKIGQHNQEHDPGGQGTERFEEKRAGRPGGAGKGMAVKTGGRTGAGRAKSGYVKSAVIHLRKRGKRRLGGVAAD